MQILFIHGRAQENFTQESLQNIWTNALKLSFENAKLNFPDHIEIKLPYYGKDLILQRDQYSEDIKNGKYKMRSPDQENELDKCYKNLLEDLRKNAAITKKEVAEEAGLTDQYRGVLNNSHVIALSRLVDNRLNCVSNLCVKWKTIDVVTYLIVEGARQEINNIIISSLTEQPTIIIAHSLGTVIAYDLLQNLKEKKYDIRGLITLGSPLGVNAVKRQLYPRPTYPPILNGPWVNIYDPKDKVALNPLTKTNFRVTPEILSHEIENQSENRHDITPYLSSPIIAETLKRIMEKIIE